MRPYLTPTEAAALTGVTLRTLERQVDAGALPVLHLSRRLRRIEAWAVLVDAPPILPGAPRVLDVAWLAACLGVPAAAICGAIRAHQLPARRVGGRWQMRRADVYDWLHANTTGGIHE